MIRVARRPEMIVPLVALAAGLALAPSRAEAQVKPLTITGHGSAPNGLSLIPYTPAPQGQRVLL